MPTLSTLNLCCCSVAKSCLTLCDPLDCSTPGFPVLHHLPELLKLMSIESVMPSNYLILCLPLLLFSVFPSNRVFSSELTLLIRWPKYWSFSINPSHEYSESGRSPGEENGLQYSCLDNSMDRGAW